MSEILKVGLIGCGTVVQYGHRPVLMDMIHAVYLAEWLVGEAARQVKAFVDAPEYAAIHMA